MWYEVDEIENLVLQKWFLLLWLPITLDHALAKRIRCEIYTP